MVDKILSTISSEVLSRSFDYKGHDMPFRDYLVEKVFPYIDLSKDTVVLKNRLMVSMKEFLEESVFYTCQNKYHGDFIEFANDNNVSIISMKNEERKQEEVETKKQTDRTFVFFEEMNGPQYHVVISGSNVSLIYKDKKFNTVMEDSQDKKDFLSRIKKLDTSLFIDIFNTNSSFSLFIKSFKDDKYFYEKIISGVEKKNLFDQNIDREIEEISGIISSVENGNLFNSDALNEAYAKGVAEKDFFEIDSIPFFNTENCLKVVLKKCESFYSELISDVDKAFEEYSIVEKAEYIVDEYLAKFINHVFYVYVSGVANAVNNETVLDINETFITADLDNIIIELKSALKRIFVNPNRRYDNDSADTYIDIVADIISDEIVNYEAMVNKAIEEKLNYFGYVPRENDEGRHMMEVS